MKKLWCLLLGLLLMMSVCSCDLENDDRDDDFTDFEAFFKEEKNSVETKKQEEQAKEPTTQLPELIEPKGKKRIYKIECYDETGKLESVKTFTHDDQDRLIKISEEKFFGDMSSVDEQVLTYDSEGNLLWQVRGTPVDQVNPGHNSGVRYQYDAQGRMISKYTWEGSGTEETYEYDAAGRLSKSYSKSDYLNSESSYVYDSNGFLTKKVTTGAYMNGESYSETVLITCDEQGRVAHEQRTVNGRYDKSISYDYSDPVFLRKEITNSTGDYTSVELYSNAGQQLDVILTREGSYSRDILNGYLEKIQLLKDDGSVEKEYRFFYERV